MQRKLLLTLAALAALLITGLAPAGLAPAALAYPRSCQVDEGRGTLIMCSKTTTAGVNWSIQLADRDGDGEFVVCAQRDDHVLYDEFFDYPNRYLTLMTQGHGLSYLRSERGTVRFWLEGRWGRFQSERYGYDVSGLDCFMPL